jgi:hypothetical protein
MRWLETLSEQLVSRRCSVRFGGPHDNWDVQAAFGPFVRVRITTAVVWGWVPTYNTRLRPRPVMWVLLAAGAGLVAAGSWVGWVVVGLTAIGAGLEAVLLRRRAGKAVAVTTEGASG